MKLLLESIFAGIIISSIIFMGFAIIAGVLVTINHFGGIEYTVGSIFLIAAGIIGVIYYYQNK